MADIQLDQIQGNIFGGFSKDQQVNILLEITDPAAARATFNQSGPGDTDDSILHDVANSSSKLVLQFNNQFKALRAQGVKPESVIAATWTNIVFTAAGLQKLNAPDLTSFPKAFLDGMSARAAHLGDVGDNDPSKWEDLEVPAGSIQPDAADWNSVDVMILVASDEKSQLAETGNASRVARYLTRLDAAASGVKVLRIILGQTRQDKGEAGHEHFGFKDGVSQPAVRGIDSPDDPIADPNQGHPGQDLLQPGEFVLGYPRQIPASSGADGPNPNPGPIAGKESFPTDLPDSKLILPDWAMNGSFLVFRRLYQDVAGFHHFVDTTATTLGISSELLGAKIVGRYASGAPLERVKVLPLSLNWPPMTDPVTHLPALTGSDTLNNDFEYQDKDPHGDVVPRAAHIRKAYPRDQVAAGQSDSDAESQTQTHRILRRGIPFGASLNHHHTSGPAGPSAARGLLFFCYQTDIERQFEFVQTQWVNNQNFPQSGDGQDPLINNSTPSSPISGCPFHATGNPSACPVSFPHFVKTRGGGYFFSPSISALKTLMT